jgi:hypothetical protein
MWKRSSAILSAARNGDMMAAKIILDRIARCGVLILLIYPGSNAGQIGSRRAAILDAVANGDLTPGEAASLRI